MRGEGREDEINEWENEEREGVGGITRVYKTRKGNEWAG